MTEKSWVWDGTATGDASLAPYAREAINQWYACASHSDQDRCIAVVPGYADDFFIDIVATDTFSQVVVYPGMVVIKDFVYELTEETTFVVPAFETSATSRYDSLLLRVDFAAQTVRLVYWKNPEDGFFTTYPEVQNDDYWEIEIAIIHVVAADYPIDGKYLLTYRTFIPTFEQTQNDPINMVRNSEFMACSDLNGALEVTPDYWRDVGSPSCAAASALYPMKRGRSVTITGGVDEGMTQRIYQMDETVAIGLPYSTRTFTVNAIIQLNASTDRAKLRLYAKDIEGDVLDTELLRGATQYLPVTGINDHNYIFIDETFTFPEDVYELWVEITGDTGATTFTVGQVIVSPGYFTGGFRQFHETLMFRKVLTDTSWDGDAKSSGSTTVDLAANFGSLIQPFTKAVVVTLRARDSGSAGSATARLYVADSQGWVRGSCYVAGAGNDDFQKRQFIVPIDYDYTEVTPFSVTTANIILWVAASGAGTLDAWVEIVGIIT